MKKLNRRGYLTIEIILASVMTVVMAFFLIDLTMKLVDITDNAYVDTVFVTDKALVTKNIKEVLENDISSLGLITNVTCESDYFVIEFEGSNVDGSIDKNNVRMLSIEGNKIIYSDFEEGDDRDIFYINDIDESLINSGFSLNSATNLIGETEYYIFTISFNNIFEDEDYNIIIPITNMRSNDLVELINYAIHLYFYGRYGCYSTVIRFDNRGIYNMVTYSFSYYNQYFSGDYTTLTCYMDEERNNKYDFETLGTITVNEYFDFIFNTNIPNELYCDFKENCADCEYDSNCNFNQSF